MEVTRSGRRDDAAIDIKFAGFTMSSDQLSPWTVLQSEVVFSAPPWLQLIRQTVRLPDRQVIHDYHQSRLIDFVVIVAHTPEGKIIMERQYKHGAGRVCLFLPSGGIAAG